MKTNIVKFLEDLKLMIAKKATEFPAPWEQVPLNYQESFKFWVKTYKQEGDYNWKTAWSSYGIEYIISAINYVIEEIEVT